MLKEKGFNHTITGEPVRQRGKKRLRAEIEIEEQDEEEIHSTKHRRLSVQEPQLSATNGQFEFPGKNISSCYTLNLLMFIVLRDFLIIEKKKI